MSDESGPAFPGKHPVTGNHTAGMTIRQCYVGQVIQGMYACQNFMNECSKVVGSKEEARVQLSKWAYAQADALITEGKSPGEVTELLGRLKKSLHQVTLLVKQQAGKFPSDALRQQLIEAHEALEQAEKVAK